MDNFLVLFENGDAICQSWFSEKLFLWLTFSEFLLPICVLWDELS